MPHEVTMTTDSEKLDQLIAGQTAMARDIANLKTALEGLTGTTPAPPAPKAGDLYSFVRPAVRNVTPWLDKVVSQTLYLDEILARALHGVDWRGTILSDQVYEDAWAEIGALKALDPALLAVYGPAGANLDPALAGVCLLTGALAPVKYDPPLSSSGENRRRALAGLTIQTYFEGLPYFKGQTGGPRIG